jgi:transposase-like protein
MSQRTTIASISRDVVTEADAYRYFEGMRWRGAPACAHCDSPNVYYIEPANGVSRKTRTGNNSERRVWRCRSCKRQFSVITNTVMHGTKLPIRVWLMVLFELVSSKNGVAAREIERKYGVAGRSAWFMLHRIREAMSADNGWLLSGDVVVDETYIGGDPKNWHSNDPRKASVKRGRGTHKTPVVALIDAKTGESRSAVVPTVSGATLRRVIAENVDMAFSTLHTDALPAYMKIGQEMAAHYFVDHSAGEYTSEKSNGTNKAENFFSQLKRSLDGTHHHVSVEHLHRYLGEFDYRFSTAKMTDAERMADLATRVAGRLTYKIVKTPVPA